MKNIKINISRGIYINTLVVLITLNVFFVITHVSAQQAIPCGSEAYLQEQMQADPSLKSRMESIMADIKTKQLNSSHGSTKGLSGPIVIPVVVHVVYNTVAQNISDAQIQSQIDVLNEDYSRSNADKTNTPSVFQPYAANTNIQFVLAKRDPSGNATNGITRTATSVTSFTQNNYVKFDSYGGKNAWPRDQYLNIWVCNLSYAGYSTYPGAAASIDGVVIKYQCFGRMGTLLSASKKGRTTTHEVGHWLSLEHTWGVSVCGDDLAADTPTQEKSNSGFPVFPHVSSCSPDANGDMFMNYMDYSDDGARNMFTQGQSARMNAVLNGARSGLLTSLGGVAPGAAACNVPDGLNASSITTSGATIAWVSTGAMSYIIQYKPTSSATWVAATSLTTSFVMSGLVASTVYEYQIAGVCAGGNSSAFSVSGTFTTSAAVIPIPSTTTFIAIGNTNTSMSEAPYGTELYKEHVQFIVTKSELSSAGYNLSNNIIQSLSFFVNSASAEMMNNFAIKIAHTSVSEFSNSNFLSTSNATTVYTANFKTSGSSWNKHAFATPFLYNGSDNLLIDIIWINNTASASSTVKCSATATTRTLYYRAPNKAQYLNNNPSGTLTYYRANMQFEFVAPASKNVIETTAIDILNANLNPGMELYPNPVSNKMNIVYSSISAGEVVSVSIFDFSGAMVSSFKTITQEAGSPSISLDFNSDSELMQLGDGIYMVNIEANGLTQRKKFVLTKN